MWLRVWDAILGGLSDWRTSIPGAALLALLAVAHWIGPAGMHELAVEAASLGELLQALTGALGFIPGLAGVALLIWNSRKDPPNGRA